MFSKVGDESASTVKKKILLNPLIASAAESCGFTAY